MDLSTVVQTGPILASLFDYLDPLTYMDEETYRAMWVSVFTTMFQGTLARPPGIAAPVAARGLATRPIAVLSI